MKGLLVVFIVTLIVFTIYKGILVIIKKIKIKNLREKK